MNLNDLSFLGSLIKEIFKGRSGIMNHDAYKCGGN